MINDKNNSNIEAPPKTSRGRLVTVVCSSPVRDCPYCGEVLIGKVKLKKVMSHQEAYVKGFSLYQEIVICSKCGETQ